MGGKEILDQRRRLPDAQFHPLNGNDAVRRDGRPTVAAPRTPRRKLEILIGAGVLCFVVSMAIDTTIWPFQSEKLLYSFSPIVKRIWTPSWAVFSAGWTFWFLALWYWIVDMRGHRWFGFPFAIVGMNSIAVYCMAELIEPWLASMLKIHLTAFDAAAHTSLVHVFYDEEACLQAKCFLKKR